MFHWCNNEKFTPLALQQNYHFPFSLHTQRGDAKQKKNVKLFHFDNDRTLKKW